VHFPHGAAGSEIEEQTFRGPLQQQLQDALRHLRNRVVNERVMKRPDRAEADRVFNYPYAALEEGLVNAVYHRGYDVREPIEVRVNPGSIEILSYPGPDPSIRPESLKGERILSRRYRNRRIGEFLKELSLAEGRFTGIPKIREAMRRNGWAPPNFETDEDRTFFAVELLIHPLFAETAVEAPVDFNETERRVLRLLRDRPLSRSQIVSELGYGRISGHLKKALERLDSSGLIALTIPDRPNSKNQKRQITRLGRRILRQMEEDRS
jgi:ATP-dependent DNA helicase RecG